MHATRPHARPTRYRTDAQAPSPRTRRAERARRRDARPSWVSVRATPATAGTLPVRERGASPVFALRVACVGRAQRCQPVARLTESHSLAAVVTF